MSDDESDDFEYQPFFAGTCTCEHEQGEHSWGGCDVGDCLCEAGWEE